MGELVSIIIPVYNCEHYLPRCIESVCIQTYENIEIILIDDGSTDKSGVICDQYADNDSRIKVCHIMNSGVAHARNLGLECMHGSWCMFVDADDFVSNSIVEKLLQLALKQNVDLVTCGTYQTENENICHIPKFEQQGVPLRIEVSKFDFTKEYEHSVVWGGYST